MPTRNLDPNNLADNEDWVGNDAAFCCPLCQKVFIVSHAPPQMVPDHEAQGVRRCPWCHNSRGRITGAESQHPTTSASIEWPVLP